MRGAVGRQEEFAELTRLLARAIEGAGTIAEVTGEAGIGKSTLLRRLMATVPSTVLVWHSAPTRAEATLAWSGLVPILRQAGEATATLDGRARDVLTSLASVVPDEAVDATAAAFAFGDLLTGVAASRPLLVVLDDAQWLDAASAGALSQALRLVPRVRCLTVIARRSEAQATIEGERLAPEHSTTIRLAGLGEAEVAALVETIARRPLGQRDVATIQARTNGNPLYVVEIARALAAGASLASALQPASAGAALTARVEGLPARTRAALRAAALLATPRVDVIASVVDDPLDALAAAEEAGVVTIESVSDASGRHDLVRFTHPLLASAVVDSSSTAAVRQLHAALAEAVADRTQASLHLAASKPPASPAIAQRFETVGATALAAGAPELATTLLHASVDTTAPTDRADRARRLLALAGAQVQAGFSCDAVAALEAIDPEPGSDLEWMVLASLSVPRSRCEGSQAGARAARRALEVVADPGIRAALYRHLVYCEMQVSAERALQAANDAWAEAQYAGGEHTALAALVAVRSCEVVAGERVDLDALLADASAWAGPWTAASPPEMIAQALVWTDHPNAATHVGRVVNAVRALGLRVEEENSSIQAGEIALRQGRWQDAEARFSGVRSAIPAGLYCWSTLCAATGRADEAAELLRRAELRSRGAGDRVQGMTVEACNAYALGADRAAVMLDDADEAARAFGLGAVRTMPYRRDHVEALVAADRLDDAHAVLDRLVADAERSGLESAIADATAAAGVVAAAVGETERGRELLETAAKLHDRGALGYEHARTLLALGTVTRRAGRPSEARGHLDDAVARFGALGATPWIRRCRDELARLGRTRRATPGVLTPTEMQVASLVAAGRSNAEVAAALFVSVRTVESNLTRIYRKLAVRSRTELARHPLLAPDET